MGAGGDDSQLMFVLWARTWNRLEMVADVVELFGKFHTVREIVPLLETECSMSLRSNVEEIECRCEYNAIDRLSVMD